MASKPTLPKTITTSLPHLAGHIDHSLLHPTMTDADISAGLATARKYGVAAACIKPYSIAAARAALAGSPVRICAVAGFPHGNSTIAVKMREARDAVAEGAHEVDVVVNVGKVLSGEWAYVRLEIESVNGVVTRTVVGSGVGAAAAEGEGAAVATVSGGSGGDTGARQTGILKVIFENDFLTDEHIVRLCEICTEVGVAFAKTSTGYGFVKQPGGLYNYRGATGPQLRLMRAHCGPEVQIKAAGGVRTLDDLLYVMTLGVTRIGATATEAILEEAKKRGIGEDMIEVEVRNVEDTSGGGY